MCCTVSAGSCADAISDCAQYGQSVCSDPQYTTWAAQNCARTCNKCCKDFTLPAWSLSSFDSQPLLCLSCSFCSFPATLVVSPTLSCWFSGTVSLAWAVDSQLLSLYPVLLILSYCLFVLSCWLSVTVSLCCPVDSQLLYFYPVLLIFSYCLLCFCCLLFLSLLSLHCCVDSQVLSFYPVLLILCYCLSTQSCWFPYTLCLCLSLSLPACWCHTTLVSQTCWFPATPSIHLADSQVLCVYILLIPSHCFSILLIGTLCPCVAD